MIKESKNNPYIFADKKGKAFYEFIIKKLVDEQIREEDLIKDFSEYLFEKENFSSLKEKIEKFIYNNFAK